jgi:hypothetical protein
MHPLARAFVALYLAHLLTDFVLQSDRMVEEKRERRFLGYAKHGGIHFFTALLIVGFAYPAWIRLLNCYVAVLGLTAVHLTMDWAKCSLAASKKISNTVRPFVMDQVFHGVTVFIAAWLIVGTPKSELVVEFNRLHSNADRVLILLAVYVAVIFGGGYLVRYLTKPLLKGGLGATDETPAQLQNAGMYIGWLERFLVLTALVLQSPATVGLILTAKSIARYPEFKSFRFAEYFLIGTLLSMGIGILGGIFLLKALYGAVVLSK